MQIKFTGFFNKRIKIINSGTCCQDVGSKLGRKRSALPEDYISCNDYHFQLLTLFLLRKELPQR
jgi:hypothetical protein